MRENHSDLGTSSNQVISIGQAVVLVWSQTNQSPGNNNKWTFTHLVYSNCTNDKSKLIYISVCVTAPYASLLNTLILNAQTDLRYVEENFIYGNIEKINIYVITVLSISSK